MDQNEDTDQYIKWVMDTLDQYKKDVDIVHGSEVPPWEIQRLLSTYQSTLYGLIAEYQRNKRSISTINRQFKSWWNTKVADTRNRLIASKPAGKPPAQKEYALVAEEENKAEYEIWQEKIQDAENKTDFMKQLLDSWNSFQNILINLNRNMMSEMMALSVGDRASKPSRKPREE